MEHRFEIMDSACGVHSNFRPPQKATSERGTACFLSNVPVPVPVPVPDLHLGAREDWGQTLVVSPLAKCNQKVAFHSRSADSPPRAWKERWSGVEGLGVGPPASGRRMAVHAAVRDDVPVPGSEHIGSAVAKLVLFA